MTEESWTTRALNGHYRAGEAASRRYPMDYAIEGIMPATGATIWFGAGSTGKTQLLLWLAAHVAATGEKAPETWLGADINVRGQVLVLTAEDLREHLLQRVGAIAKRMMEETGGTPQDAEALCQRIHIMAFLSMTAAEFTERNPCLFHRKDRHWEPSNVLDGVERFLDAWNAKAEEEDRPDDRIVGVILDSAVSMAGFELVDSGATTNFLFHLNRMSRRQKMFWAVIGHTPKDAAKKADDAAIERLRGSAMWSTTPRTVVEVRLAGAAEDLEMVRADYPKLDDRDIVIVEVAKANSQNADLNPRALLRRADGAYDDVTLTYPAIFGDRSRKSATRSKAAAHTPELRRAVINLLTSVSGGTCGSTIRRDELQAAFVAERTSVPVLTTISEEIAGTAAKRPGSLAYEISRMNKDELVSTARSGVIKIINLNPAEASPIAVAAE